MSLAATIIGWILCGIFFIFNDHNPFSRKNRSGYTVTSYLYPCFTPFRKIVQNEKRQNHHVYCAYSSRACISFWFCHALVH